MKRESVEFHTKDNTILRGWLFSTENISQSPGIIMTHGFSALKEHGLLAFAEKFVEIGLCVLVYDHRNFGESDGAPRLEVDPVKQVEDMQDAISFMQSQPVVDPKKIGLWGTSFSGGHVVVVAAKDKRVSCVVSQVPFVSGHHSLLKTKHPKRWEVIQKKYAMDRVSRLQGKQPMMTPVVTENPQKSALMPQPEAYTFFKMVPHWENQVTLKSIENAGNYCPIEFIQQVSPTPLLFIIADSDTVCPNHLALQAYEKALSPKECLLVQGEHFVPHDAQFQKCVETACAWFKRYLL